MGNDTDVKFGADYSNKKLDKEDLGNIYYLFKVLDIIPYLVG